MAFSYEAILDKLEPRFTKINRQLPEKPYRRWIPLPRPNILRDPLEPYSTKRFVKNAILPVVVLSVIYELSYLLPLAYLWYQFPHAFWHLILSHGAPHAGFIGALSQVGFYQLPYVLLILLAFNFLINYPRYYFWNRRAARLRREGLPPHPPLYLRPEEAVDFWPPAPSI